jgi:hypothetical protein
LPCPLDSPHKTPTSSSDRIADLPMQLVSVSLIYQECGARASAA